MTVVIGSGQEKILNSSEKSASFVQAHAICTYEKSLFVTDVAAGTIRLVTSLSKTVAFLKNLGCLYDTFGIHEKGTPAKKVTLREVKEVLRGTKNSGECEGALQFVKRNKWSRGYRGYAIVRNSTQ